MHFQNTAAFREAKKNASLRPPPGWVPPSGLCECGCGQATTVATVTSKHAGTYAGHPRRFIRGHMLKHKRRETAGGWRGGRGRSTAGYWMLHMPGHHLADGKGYVPEHRLAWEQANGRRLRDDEHVHHIDGDPTNNAPENLAAMTRKEHAQTHAKSAETSRRKSEAHRRRYADPEERRKTSEAITEWWAKRRNA